jgi:hypothetical protein
MPVIVSGVDAIVDQLFGDDPRPLVRYQSDAWSAGQCAEVHFADGLRARWQDHRRDLDRGAWERIRFADGDITGGKIEQNFRACQSRASLVSKQQR